MNNSARSTSNDVKEKASDFQNESGGEFPTDSDLARLAGTGDVNAFSQLLKRYQNPVYALLYNLSQNAETADDLTQQTFIKVWGALPGFEMRSAFSTWLYRIAHNVFYDFTRKKEPPTEDIQGENFHQSAIDPGFSSNHSLGAEPDEAMMRKEKMALLRKAMQRLSEEHRTVLILKEVNGLSYKEIAEVTNCSVGTVMSRIHYARQNLRIILHEYDY